MELIREDAWDKLWDEERMALTMASDSANTKFLKFLVTKNRSGRPFEWWFDEN